MKYKLSEVLFWAAWLAALVLLPSTALAWGPGTHIECSMFMLKHLVLLAPVVKKVLSAFPSEFIYGSLCPDMFLGKRFVSLERNSHNWDVGFRILESAENKAQHAFALGYLSHLAADTIAHNVFVPDQLLSKYNVKRQGHMTYELLFDMTMDDNVWSECKKLARRPFRQCNNLIRTNTPRTILPKRIDYMIFRSGGVLVKLGGWQRIVRRMRNRWGHLLDKSAAAPYLRAIHDTVAQFLNDPHRAACRVQCPTGGPILTQAESLRATFKRLSRKSMLQPEYYSTMVTDFNTWREQEFHLDKLPDPSPAPAQLSA